MLTRLAFLLLLPATAVAQTRSTLIRNVTVIDGTGAAPRAGQSVLVSDGVIARIGSASAVRPPAGTDVVEGRGRWLIPGLIDTHAHASLGPIRNLPSGQREAASDPIVAHLSLRSLLAFGVTTIRDPGVSSARLGVALRDSVAAGTLIGPRILTAGDIIDATTFPGLVVTARTPEAVRAEVRRQAAEGVDWIKLYASLDPASVTAGIDEGHRLGKKVVGHLIGTTWSQAARAGIDGIVHAVPTSPMALAPAGRAAFRANIAKNARFMLQWFEYYDPKSAESDSMIGAMVEHHVVHDPTLVVFEGMAWGDSDRIIRSPDLRFAAPSLLDNWRSGDFTFAIGFTADDFERSRAVWPKVLAFVKQMYDRGVLLMAGSDANNPWTVPGPSLHRELELLVDAGIPPLEVLTIATRNGARGLGLLERLGTIEQGKRADLVLLEADPIAKIGNTRRIAWVMKDGIRRAPNEIVEGR